MTDQAHALPLGNPLIVFPQAYRVICLFWHYTKYLVLGFGQRNAMFVERRLGPLMIPADWFKELVTLIDISGKESFCKVPTYTY